MASTKLLNEWGVLLKAESSYDAGTTLAAASDGFLVQEQPDVVPRYVHDGQRRGERGPMNVGQQRVKKSGRWSDPTLVHEAAGAGTAYSASDLPSVHVALRAAGFDATLDSTASAEKYDYVLGTGISAAAEVYSREELYELQGIYSDLTITLGEDDITPAWQFPLQALMPALPSGSSVPSITYPSVKPPVGENVSLTLGTFASARVRSFEFALNRELSSRADKNQAGHAGFAPGARRPTLDVLIEAESLAASPYHTASAIDPYELTERASALSVSLEVGDTQYERWKLSASNAQLAQEVEQNADGPSALWRLVWELNPSAPGQKDNATITFD